MLIHTTSLFPVDLMTCDCCQALTIQTVIVCKSSITSDSWQYVMAWILHQSIFAWLLVYWHPVDSPLRKLLFLVSQKPLLLICDISVMGLTFPYSPGAILAF